MIPADAHHNLPQKFVDFFESKGINIHDPKYGAWVERTKHRSEAYAYNKDWERYIRDFLKHSTEQILDFGRSLARSYGYNTHF